MKKIILYIFSSILFIPCMTFAQQEQDSKFYLKVQGGYNIGREKASLFNYFTSEIGINGLLHVYDGVDSVNPTFTNLSYGKGLDLDIAGGYMFSKYFGFELGAGYRQSPEYTTFMEFTKYGQDWRFTSNFRTFTLTPAFVLSLTTPKVSPYAKIGAEIGLGARINNTHERLNENNAVISRQKEALEGTTLGFSTTLGLAVHCSKRVSVFLEFNRTDMDFRPCKRKIFEYNDLGVNMKEAFYGQKGDVEIELEDRFAEVDTNVRRTYSINSIGINAGVMFKL